METVTNIANTATTAASKMIWGDKTAENETGGQEPVSGVEGKGTIDEPYDQGNKENPTVPTKNTSDTPLAYRPKHADTTDSLPDKTTKDTADLSNKSVDNILKDTTVSPLGDTHKDTDTTVTPVSNLKATSSNQGITNTTGNPTLPSDKDINTSGNKMSSLPDTKTQANPKNPINLAEGGPIQPHHNTEKTGVIGNMGSNSHGSVVNPSSSSHNPGGAPDSSSFVPKQQGADKPSSTPEHHENDAIRETKLEAEKALDAEKNLKKHRDPNDHSGEPMHMHDGKDHSRIPASQEERRDSKAGMPGGQEHGKTYGTGEQWVKTSGVAAEGGDFDVTKPGAGREATRILEEKGIHKSTPADHSAGSHAGTGEGKEKVSVTEKIKNKLHIGSHNK